MSGELDQVAALARLADLAKGEIGTVLRTVRLDRPAEVRDALVASIPAIADRYGLAAAALAADWYEDLRDEAGIAGSFEAVLADLPDEGRYSSLSAWASTQTDVETLVAGGLQRIIANAHRDTIRATSWADPGAAGWARFGRGVETCDFCRMLITRGGVYTERTGAFGSHDWCNCGAGPVWKGAGGARVVDAYQASARRRSAATRRSDNARAREWIADNL